MICSHLLICLFAFVVVYYVCFELVIPPNIIPFLFDLNVCLYLCRIFKV
jgi:hypothetical protein